MPSSAAKKQETEMPEVVETKFRIEKDVPLPNRANASQYPLAQMEVGDSFRVEEEDVPWSAKHGTRSVSTLRNRISTYARSHLGDARFRVLTEGSGARVWRVR